MNDRIEAAVSKIMDVNPLRITVPYIRAVAREHIALIIRKNLPDIPRVLDWFRDPNRKPSHLAFTAGPDRELADELEGILKAAADNPSATNPCPRCKGNGRVEMLEHCPVCNGSGKKVVCELPTCHDVWKYDDPAAWRVADANRQLDARPDPIVGLDLPDGVGVWFHRETKRWWIVRQPIKDGDIFCRFICDNGCPSLEDVRADRLPRGGWSRAVPESEVVELRKQVAEARKMADSLCTDCDVGHKHNLADVMEKHVFRAGQEDGKALAQKSIGKLEGTVGRLESERNELRLENERLRTRLLSAAGDDLCRLTQEEIKAYSSGAVQIPPKEEFLASCERFHAQVAGEAGVLGNCLTLAQLIAENERLQSQLTTAQALAKRLADDALIALAGSKISTPEEGFLKAPHTLSDCIERLRKQRDDAIESWQEERRLLRQERARIAELESSRYPRLIESGPLPEGHLVKMMRSHPCSFYEVEFMEQELADWYRQFGWQFWDYGPLPEPAPTCRPIATEPYAGVS